MRGLRGWGGERGAKGNDGVLLESGVRGTKWGAGVDGVWVAGFGVVSRGIQGINSFRISRLADVGTER